MLLRVQCVLRAVGLIVWAAFSLGTVAAQELTPPKPPAGTSGPTPATLEVTDETGRRVRLPLEIRRIVSLAPNLTETVFALGAGDRLVGVTDFCDFPAEAASRTRVGGPMNPSLEQIVALKPDLVLAQANSGNRRETVEALERLGLPVFASNAQTVEQILDSMSNLAGLMGAPASGEKLVADLRTRLVEVKRRLTGRPARRALFVVWHDPLITIGKRTFIADALRWAGAEPAIDLEQDWPRVSLEEVVRVQPEFLVLAGSHSETVQRTVDDLSQRPGWRGLEAVRARRIAIISDAVNRPAPRLVEAIEQLARQLHPDAFEEKPAGGPPPRAEASCNR